MKIIREDTASANNTTTIESESNPDDITVKSKRISFFFAVTRDLNDLSNIIYTNLCSRFSNISLKDNKYVFILCEYNSNLILSKLMRNCSDAEMNFIYNKPYNA